MTLISIGIVWYPKMIFEIFDKRSGHKTHNLTDNSVHTALAGFQFAAVGTLEANGTVDEAL